MDTFELEDSEFDAIVIGTGITESIIASSLAINKKRVLHLDQNAFYGGNSASLDLESFITFLQKTKSYKDNISFYDIKISIQGKRWDADNEPFPEKLKELLVESRKYAIELVPKIIPAMGETIDLLLESETSRYLDFKLIDQMAIFFEGSLRQIPCSREDIFKMKSVSLKEKRILMKFLQSIIDNSSDDSNDNRTFVALLEDYELTEKYKLAIIYCLALWNGPAEKLTVHEGKKRLRTYLSSMGRYGNSAFIKPMHGGVSELSQAFCRLSAVYGSVYILNQPITIGTISETSDNEVTVNNSKLKTQQLIISPEYSNFRTGSTKGHIFHAVAITISSIVDGTGDCIIAVLPPGLDNSINRLQTPIHILQINHHTSQCPEGKYIIYVWVEVDNNSHENNLHWESCMERLFEEIAPVSLFMFKRSIWQPNKEPGHSNLIVTNTISSKWCLADEIHNSTLILQNILKKQHFFDK